MYKSPIDLMVDDMVTQMHQKEEQTIFEAVRNCGVSVDKEELIKALEYDRNQYSKGYKDGVNEILDKIKAEIEQTFLDDAAMQEYTVNECLRIIDKYRA